MIADKTAGNAKITSAARMAISSNAPRSAAAVHPIATPTAGLEENRRPGDHEGVPRARHEQRDDVAPEVIGAEQAELERRLPGASRP